MTDLPIYPDSYLPAPIEIKQKLENGWTICKLKNGQFIYFDRIGYFFDITEESLKWNLYWNARTASQEDQDTARSAATRNALDPTLVDQLLLFMRTHATPA